jgi:hypothetical protein
MLRKEMSRKVQYTSPTKFTPAPYRTMMNVVGDDDKVVERYIQVSADERNPQWETIGTVLSTGFQEFFDNTAFMDECLRLYHYHHKDPLKNIVTIINNHNHQKK